MRQSKSNSDVSKRAAKKKCSALLRRGKRSILCALIASVTFSPMGGCGLLSRHVPPGPHDTKESYHDNYGLQIEYPEVADCATQPSIMVETTDSPFTLEDPASIPVYELSLQEAINIAVTQSPVLRTTGAALDVRVAPQSVNTIYDPALTAASPVLGTEAALSAFDAQYTQQLFWDNQNRPQNINPFAFGGGGGVGQVFPTDLKGTFATFNGELRKTTATGASFALRHVVNYDASNRSGGIRLFNTAFSGWVEAEWRQPLLQGAGVTYNRIAGPNAAPGQYNGVLIARINEDVSLADFESAVIQVVSEVEQAYWDLVTAYRILDTAVKGREAALQTFQYQQVRLEVGSGRSDEEAQARSQFYQFEAQVQQALGGVLGLYRAESNLRYLIGLAQNDGRIIRPTTEPIDTRVVFDWDSALNQALERRVDIRKQRLEVKRREMELIAARLNYRPRLDLLSQYRFQGLGDHLVGDTGVGSFDSLYAEIFGADFQEWQTGIELSFPVGLRTAGVAIAHARLNVRRDRAILANSELFASYALSDAVRNIDVRHKLMETNYNRLLADLNQVDVLRRRYLDGSDNINFLLQAQRQVVASATDFYRSLSEYNLAIRDLHREKGSLLAYNHVQLSEGPWAAGAAYDAYQVGRFLTPRHNPSKVCAPVPINSGPFDPSAIQNTEPLPGSSPAGEAMPYEPAPAPQPMIDGQYDESGLVPAEVEDAGGLIETDL